MRIVELAERGLRQRDLGDPEAREVRAGVGSVATMALVSGSSAVLEDGVSTPRRMEPDIGWGHKQAHGPPMRTRAR